MLSTSSVHYSSHIPIELTRAAAAILMAASHLKALLPVRLAPPGPMCHCYMARTRTRLGGRRPLPSPATKDPPSLLMRRCLHAGRVLILKSESRRCAAGHHWHGRRRAPSHWPRPPPVGSAGQLPPDPGGAAKPATASSPGCSGCVQPEAATERPLLSPNWHAGWGICQRLGPLPVGPPGGPGPGARATGQRHYD